MYSVQVSPARSSRSYTGYSNIKRFQHAFEFPDFFYMLTEHLAVMSGVDNDMPFLQLQGDVYVCVYVCVYVVEGG